LATVATRAALELRDPADLEKSLTGAFASIEPSSPFMRRTGGTSGHSR
jgi:hypothetical protein